MFSTIFYKSHFVVTVLWGSSVWKKNQLFMISKTGTHLFKDDIINTNDENEYVLEKQLAKHITFRYSNRCWCENAASLSLPVLIILTAFFANNVLMELLTTFSHMLVVSKKRLVSYNAKSLMLSSC